MCCLKLSVNILKNIPGKEKYLILAAPINNLMPKFFCQSCSIEFDTEKPVKKEYKDYILGPCSKNVAYCPLCGKESAEKIVPKPLKAVQKKEACDGDCRHCPAH